MIDMCLNPSACSGADKEKICKNSDFKPASSVSIASLAKDLSFFIDMKLSAERILTHLNTLIISMGGEASELIGKLGGHSEASYLLDRVVNQLFNSLLQNVKSDHTQAYFTARVIFQLALLRGSLQDMMVLISLLNTTVDTIDLTDDLSRFFGKQPKMLY